MLDESLFARAQAVVSALVVVVVVGMRAGRRRERGLGSDGCGVVVLSSVWQRQETQEAA